MKMLKCLQNNQLFFISPQHQCHIDFKDKFSKKVSESVFIPQGSIHRIENPYKVPVKILEIQTGAILKESDIVRYQDIYGRVR